MGLVEGVDYIVDFYALLEVDRNANAATIRKKGNNLRRLYHPDKTRELPDDLSKEARRKFELYSKAMSVLLDDEMRTLYDERLNSFPEHLISNDGHAIEDLNRRHIDIDYLLKGDVEDISKLEEYVKAMTNYSEEGLNEAREAYKAMPDNKTMKKIYRSQLHSKINYISLMEGLMWAQAGVKGDTEPAGIITHVDDYTSCVDAEIEKVVNEQIPKNIKQRALAHNAGLATALLPYDSDKPKPEEQLLESDLSDVVYKTMVENFKERTEAIREYAKKKQATLQELLELTDYEFLGERKGADSMDLFLMVNEGKSVLAGFSFSGTKIELMDKEWHGKTLKNLEEYKTDSDVVLIQHDTEISDFLMEVTYVAEKIVNKKTKN
ncbi:J domain-containing protein [Candidatus Woesearchaeota archaeon]|nr:J domain-containing protein [Candidatus Woesearchaeota archaeon]